MPEVVGRLRTPRLAAAPASPVVGELYYDTVANVLYFWNGSAWVSTASSAGTIYDSDQIGTVKTFAGKTIPANWMLADGRALSRSAYPELFTALGTMYGAGDGSTTFNLPDLRNRMIYGASDPNAQGASGGAATHTLGIGEVPSHSHGGATQSGSTPDHRHNADPGLSFVMAGVSNVGAGTGFNWGTYAQTAGADRSLAHTHPISAEGGGAAHNNLPPYLLVALIIKVTGAQIDSGGALVGPTGPKGDPGPWRGAWSAATAYNVADSVSYYDGTVTGSYRRKVAGTTAGDPKTDTTNWELIASGGSVGGTGPAGADVSPWLVDVDVLAGAHAQVNWPTPAGAGDASTIYQGWRLATVQNAEVSWDLVLGAGTWDIDLMMVQGPDRGTYSVQIDGVEVGTVIGYDPGVQYNRRGVVTGVVIATTRKVRLTLKMATKHASSSSYYAYLQHVQLRRTVGGTPAAPVAAPPLVSSLPASPADGQEVYYLADAAAGIIWHLRYRAASASAYKWEFLGGSALGSAWLATNSSQTPSASGTFDKLRTSAPTRVALPLAGEFDFRFGASGQELAGGTTRVDIYLRLYNDATNAQIGQTWDEQETWVVPPQVGNFKWKLVGESRLTLASAITVGLRGAINTTQITQVAWYSAYLRATPVRVG